VYVPAAGGQHCNGRVFSCENTKWNGNHFENYNNRLNWLIFELVHPFIDLCCYLFAYVWKVKVIQ
jgi:hypothetical protein